MSRFDDRWGPVGPGVGEEPLRPGERRFRAGERGFGAAWTVVFVLTFVGVFGVFLFSVVLALAGKVGCC